MENRSRYVVTLLMRSLLKVDECNIYYEKGEESDFIELLTEFNYYLARSDDKDEKIIDILNTITNHYTSLDYGIVFNIMDLNIISKRNASVIDKILKSVYYDSFINKMDRCNDPALVCYYFDRYREVNNLSSEDISMEYKRYLKKYLDRTGNTYDKLLLKLIEDNENIFHQGVDLEKYYAWIVNLLIHFADITDENISKIIHFADKLDKANGDLVKREVLKVSDIMFFQTSLGSKSSDRVRLYLQLGDYNNAIDTFNRDEYKIYNETHLNELIAGALYYGYFDDQLDDLLTDFFYPKFSSGEVGGMKTDSLNDFIFSEKVKVISIESIKILEEILPKEVFNSFMLHVIDDGIIVYWINRGYCYSHQYFDTKNHRNLSDENYNYYCVVKDYLKRDKYLSRVK